MGRGPRYKVPRRRRREGKTNYKKRYIMVMSRKIRFVVRTSLNHVWVQVIKAEPQGDITIAAAHSRELVKKYGWQGGTSNLPVAYLVGLLAGYRAIEKGVYDAILDIGFAAPKKGAKVFAVLKGALDAGLHIPHDESILPSEDRIRGEHIASYAKMLSENNPEKYQRQFSKYLQRGFVPEDLPNHFEEVANKIRDDYKEVEVIAKAKREVMST